MSIADELAKALQGANITLNVHHGTGDINSQNGPRITQNNSAARHDPVCNICQQSGGSDLYGHAFGSYTHQHCLEEQGRKLREQKAARSAEFGKAMQQIAAVHADRVASAEPTDEQKARWYQPLAPGEHIQIATPQPDQSIVIDEPRRSYRDEIAAKFAGDYEELQSARARYNAAEFERVNQTLTDWRARHPIEHMVEPLPPEMHTHLPDTIMTNREAQQQALWNLEYDKI